MSDEPDLYRMILPEPKDAFVQSEAPDPARL
jgi:hypothetical protein